jgi:hypothetical protein
MANNLEQIILEETKNFRTDRLTMSFGEIMNMYKEGEININPDFQRSFRWSKEKQTNLIESILLGIPIPPIFVAENEDGVWELVDGLQRISTVLSFFAILENVSKEKRTLVLGKGKLIPQLEDVSIQNMSFKLKLRIKRATVGVEVLNRDSDSQMKYELFKRLNTTSEGLSEQEMRNAIYSGKLNTYINQLASHDTFVSLMKPTKKQKESMYLSELVLRYLAFKNSIDMKDGVRSHLDKYMEENVNTNNFDEDKEKEEFIKIITYINDNFGTEIFKAKNGQVTKNLYDSLTYVLREKFDKYQNNPKEFQLKVDELKVDNSYDEISRKKRETRTQDRIVRALEIF